MKYALIPTLYIFFLAFTACRYNLSPEEAKNELIKMRLSISEETFFESIKNGNMKAVKLFLTHGVSQKVKNDGLLYAAGYHKPNIITLLIEQGADINHTSKETSANALFHATGNMSEKAIETISILLKNNADINAKAKLSVTPLMQASASGYYKIVEFLLNNGADPNIQDEIGWTALIYAGQQGHDNVIKLLLRHGAKQIYELPPPPPGSDKNLNSD